MEKYAAQEECALTMAEIISNYELSQFRRRVLPPQPADSLDAELHREKQHTIALVESAAQELALEHLLKQFSHHDVCANKDSPSLSLFARNRQNPDRWCFDTLDGGFNFIEGNENFGFAIGYSTNGRFALSVLAFPKKGLTYIATEHKGLMRCTAHRECEQINIAESYKLSKNDTVYLGSRVSEPVARWLNSFGNDIVFKQTKAAYPTVLRALDVLSGTAKAYLTYESDMYDMGPVSFAIQAAGGAFVTLDGQDPIWVQTTRSGKERIILDSYALLGPKKYVAELSPLARTIIEVAEGQ